MVRQTGIANNIPINIPTRIIASFSGLALYRSRQRRLRSNNDVRFSPSCSGGAAHTSLFISSPINLFPYVGSKTLIWNREKFSSEVFPTRKRVEVFTIRFDLDILDIMVFEMEYIIIFDKLMKNDKFDW